MTLFLIGWLTFVITAATPGPSTLAIMATSLAHGRRAGLLFALGVCAGSVFWGMVAALGLGTLLANVAWALGALKIAGGLYLLWLAWKAARSAMGPDRPAVPPAQGQLMRAGAALHLTNPKAVLGWSAVIAIGLPPGAGAGYITVLLVGCAALALAVNLGYAFAFSAAPLAAAYRRARRAIDATVAGLFAVTGIGLLAWRA